MAEPSVGPQVGLTPYLTIKGGRAAEAIDFYKAAFGATEMHRAKAGESERLMHAHLTINGASLMLSDDFPEYHGGKESADPGGSTLHLQVDDADAWWNPAMRAGGQATMPIADQFWGDRYGQLKDPYGHTWSIGSPIKK